MIEFVCDNCSAVKEPDETWIVGLAAEAVGVVSARREISIQSAWTRATAVHPLAVHFCSIQCKDECMARLFAPEVPVADVIVEETGPVEVVVEREIPEGKRVITRTRTTGRKRSA